jgi:hypothetical protein
VNSYFAAQAELFECSSTANTLDDVLCKVVDHHNRIKLIGPVKCDSSADKKSDGKDNKKEGDKSAVANPVIREGDTSSTIVLCFKSLGNKGCKLCAKRGELFLGKLNKGGKERGAKASQSFNSSEETCKRFCLVCSQLRHVPEWASRNHTTQECGQLAKFNEHTGEGLNVERQARIRRDNYTYQSLNSQRSCTGRHQSPAAQYLHYDARSSYTSPYPTQMLMPPQTYLAPLPPNVLTPHLRTTIQLIKSELEI